MKYGRIMNKKKKYKLLFFLLSILPLMFFCYFHDGIDKLGGDSKQVLLRVGIEKLELLGVMLKNTNLKN